MNAKRDDFSRIQEIHDVIVQTKTQIEKLGFTEERFLNPSSDEDDLIAEGILNRVLRVTEEAGAISDEVSEECGFSRHAVTGVRNRLAHAYGNVDRKIIWLVIVDDFDALLRGCQVFCEHRGISL